MCFSNKAQVKYNQLENFPFKNMGKRGKDWSLRKNFQFFWPDILRKGLIKFEAQGRFIKNKKVFIQYKTSWLD